MENKWHCLSFPLSIGHSHIHYFSLQGHALANLLKSTRMQAEWHRSEPCLHTCSSDGPVRRTGLVGCYKLNSPRSRTWGKNLNANCSSERFFQKTQKWSGVWGEVSRRESSKSWGGGRGCRRAGKVSGWQLDSVFQTRKTKQNKTKKTPVPWGDFSVTFLLQETAFRPPGEFSKTL